MVYVHQVTAYSAIWVYNGGVNAWKGESHLHVFDYRTLEESVDADFLSMTNVIFDLRARNDLRQKQDETTFDRLREAATIESVRGSNAIEGIVTTRARLAELVRGAEPRTHGEREILGYKSALQEIYAPGFSADLSEDYRMRLRSWRPSSSTSYAPIPSLTETVASRVCLPRCCCRGLASTSGAMCRSRA